MLGIESGGNQGSSTIQNTWKEGKVAGLSAITVRKREVAKLLGVCERTVDNLRKKQGLPFIKMGGTVLFDPVAIRQWVKDQAANN